MLAEGAFVVSGVSDILLALSRAGADVTMPTQRRSKPESPGPVPEGEQQLYAALSPDPASLDELVRITGLDFAELCGGLERLARAGLALDVGGWWQRV